MARPNASALVIRVITDDIPQVAEEIRTLILNEGQNYSEATREFLFAAYKKLLDEKRRASESDAQ